MAKIRLRMGPCEVEIESGDFYVDNDTASAAIDRIARSMQRVAAPRAHVLAASEEAAANIAATAAGTADAGSSSSGGGKSGGGKSGRAAVRAGGSRPLPTPAAAASTAAAAPLAEAPPIRRAASRAQQAPLRSPQHPQPRQQGQCPDLSSVLDGLDEAEMFEPEFDEPRRVAPPEVASRLRVLAAAGFFAEPRTVTEAVDRMAERGWLAGPLDVSKALARMSMGREMRREARGYKTYYCVALPAEPALLAEPAPAPVPS